MPNRDYVVKKIFETFQIALDKSKTNVYYDDMKYKEVQYDDQNKARRGIYDTMRSGRSRWRVADSDCKLGEWTQNPASFGVGPSCKVLGCTVDDLLQDETEPAERPA